MMLRSILLALALTAGLPAVAQADPAAEAREAGRAARDAIAGTTPAARDLVESMTPGYTETPPEAALEEGNLSAAGNARLAQCDAAPGTPGCEALANAHADATARADSTPDMRSDPAVIEAITASREVTLDGLEAVYSDCVSETTETGIVTRDIQFCHRYYRRDLENSCTKTRDVRVTWQCPAGSMGPYLDHWGDRFERGTNYCYRIARHVATCGENQTISPDQTQCFDNETGETSPAAMVPEHLYFAATPHALEAWVNACADYESRAPPGTLLPDGEETPDELPFMATGRIDKCVRSTSVCTDPYPTTRLINGYPITRECWAYTNTFDCVSSTGVSDCDQPRFGSCSPAAAPTCIDQDEKDGFCTAERLEFDCTHRDTRRTETRLNCGAQTFSDRDGNVWDASYPPDPDLLTVVTYMEAGRQAGRYMDQGSLTVFNGVNNSCKKKLFGLINCCSRSGIDPQMFNNLSAIMGVAGTVGNALASTYMFDALFVSDAPNWVISGFSSLFGSGTSSTLAGLLTGNLTVSQFATSLIPGPWTIAMMAIQMSGLLSCSENEQVLAMKRDSDLCVDNGSRCSKRLKVVRTCIERTYSYCCFNSRLAKIINRQGRAQLGIHGGGCGGFTVAQLQALDLSRMDLSEFMDEIRAAALEMPAIAPGRIGACALAGGACE